MSVCSYLKKNKKIKELIVYIFNEELSIGYKPVFIFIRVEICINVSRMYV